MTAPRKARALGGQPPLPRSAPLPTPLPTPQAPEEQLRHAAVNLGVATLGPEQAAALLIRIGDLEAIAQRAQEAYESDIWVNGTDAARYILTGKGPR